MVTIFLGVLFLYTLAVVYFGYRYRKAVVAEYVQESVKYATRGSSFRECDYYYMDRPKLESLFYAYLAGCGWPVALTHDVLVDRKERRDKKIADIVAAQAAEVREQKRIDAEAKRIIQEEGWDPDHPLAQIDPDAKKEPAGADNVYQAPNGGLTWRELATAPDSQAYLLGYSTEQVQHAKDIVAYHAKQNGLVPGRDPLPHSHAKVLAEEAIKERQHLRATLPIGELQRRGLV